MKAPIQRSPTDESGESDAARPSSRLGKDQRSLCRQRPPHYSLPPMGNVTQCVRPTQAIPRHPVVHHSVRPSFPPHHRFGDRPSPRGRAAAAVGLLLLAACSVDPETARQKAADLVAPNPQPRFATQAKLFEPGGGGVIAYLGVDVDPLDPKPGQALTLTHYWRVEHAPSGDASVLVHGEVGGRPVADGDHQPLYGRLPTSRWRVGDRWADRHVLPLAKDAPTGRMNVWVGLVRDGTRWTVEALAGGQDGRDRLRAASIDISGTNKSAGDPTAAARTTKRSEPGDLPIVEIPMAARPIRADGRLTEADWKRAPVLTFRDSMGRPKPIRHGTRLRLLYDREYLYVAFEADDIDITERYSRRDDPIYEHEAVELFIMPRVIAPKTGPYVELQASPGGVIFDAAFTGPRQGFNKSYGAGQDVGTTINGTLNDPQPDRGWTSEWRVPFARIRGASGAPKPGDEWRMNAFRIERYRDGERSRAEYSAWSPPGVGDFHYVKRFGRMRFVGRQ